MSHTGRSRLSRPSPRTLERGLAGLLLALLAAYVVGVLAEGSVPAVRVTGIVAVHLAVVVALALPVVLLGHAALGSVSLADSTPRWIEVGVAGVVLGTLVVGTVVASTDLPDPLVWTVVGGLVLLAGLLLGSS